MINLPRFMPLPDLRSTCLLFAAAGGLVVNITSASLAQAFQRSVQKPATKPLIVISDAKKIALESEHQALLAMRELVRGSLQQELDIVDRLLGLEREVAQKMLGLVEAEWESKLVVPLQSNTFRSRAPVRDSLLESAMLDWLGRCVSVEQVHSYSTEVELRANFRIRAFQDQLLDLMQLRYSLSESQVDELGGQLREMQPPHDHVMAIRQLTESAQHRLVAPLVNTAYSNRRITSSQRNAVARNELGTVQATYPELRPRLSKETEFHMGTIKPGNGEIGDADTENVAEPNQSGDSIPPQEGVVAQRVSRADNVAVVRFNNNQATIHGRLSKPELEEMLYGVVGGSRQAFQFRRKDDIQRQVDRIQFVCHLSEVQKDKISQAVEIEIERNVSEIASLLSDIDDETSAEKKQQVYFQAHQKLQQMQLEKHFETSSLWDKVLHSTLTQEQQVLLSDEESRKRDRQKKLERELLVLHCQQLLGLIEIERYHLTLFLNRPSQDGISTIDDCRAALKVLTQEERRNVLPDSVWKRWE